MDREEFLNEYTTRRNQLSKLKKRLLKADDELKIIVKEESPQERAWTGYESDNSREDFHSEHESDQGSPKATQTPFTRHEIDEATDREFRAKKRFGDPLDTFTTKKPEPIRRQWENRFNITPGKEWDGTDRSTGFEERYLRTHSRKSYENSQAYKEFAREL